MKMNIRYFLLLAVTFIFMACDQGQQPGQTAQAEASGHDHLIAVLHPTEGNDAEGVIRFTRVSDGVRVHGEISGLDPDSRHGFHVHQYGDCSAPNADSAGGHYAPEDGPHGAPTDEERHMGDMGNIESNQDGVARVDYVDKVMELGGENTILGRGVIVHAEEDDLQTQPTGDAGGRLGCGVIGVAQVE